MIAGVNSFSCSVVQIYKGDAAAITHSILAHNTSQFRKNLETKNFLTHVRSSFLYLRHIWYGILEMLDKVTKICYKLSNAIICGTMR